MEYPDTLYIINNFDVSNTNCPITISIDTIEDGQIEDYTTQNGFEVETTSVEADAQIEINIPRATEIERMFKFRVKA